MQIAIANKTMSSREIADLIEKQHSNIKISAERLFAAGVIGTLAMREFTHNGNTYTEYLLSKRDSLILVAQNCPEFTATTSRNCLCRAKSYQWPVESLRLYDAEPNTWKTAHTQKRRDSVGNHPTGRHGMPTQAHERLEGIRLDYHQATSGGGDISPLLRASAQSKNRYLL